MFGNLKKEGRRGRNSESERVKRDRGRNARESEGKHFIFFQTDRLLKTVRLTEKNDWIIVEKSICSLPL